MKKKTQCSKNKIQLCFPNNNQSFVEYEYMLKKKDGTNDEEHIGTHEVEMR